MPAHDATVAAPRNYRYYDFILGAFVCVILCSNLIGPAKVATVNLPIVGDFTFGAGVLFFPISYVFGDILTEVYGYARARRVIWSGLTALIFASIMATVVVKLPPPPAGAARRYEASSARRRGSYWRRSRHSSAASSSTRIHWQNEDLDERQCALVAHHRLDDCRRRRRLARVLSVRVPRRLGNQLVITV
jgi:hypothetical protein